jgi:hypothetical protein
MHTYRETVEDMISVKGTVRRVNRDNIIGREQATKLI